MKFVWFILCIGLSVNVYGQAALVSEPVLQQAIRLTGLLPGTIHEAYQQYNVKKDQQDSFDLLIQKAYPLLADKMQKRSARLNAMAGYNTPDAILSLTPPNQKMTTFFLNEWEEMDNLERKFAQQVKAFYGENVYKVQGYLPAWDSVYKKRLPALIHYRDGVLKLVQKEISYLKANERMFKSSHEAERMQYIEAELSVLQKLILLASKYKRVVTEDGVDKVAFCQERPDACQHSSNK